MPNLKFHEAANIFPLMEEIDPNGFAALVEDIRQHGLQTPIELFEGKVIDGRNRYKACLLACVAPETVAIQTDDPVAWVTSANLHRRHLNETQRGVIAQKSMEFYEKAAKERMREGGGDKKSGVRTGAHPIQHKGKSRAQAGAAVGVSGSTVGRVKQAMKTATPALAKAMEAGRITAMEAVRIAKLSPAEQLAVVRGDTIVPPRNKPMSRGSDGRPPIRHAATSAMEFAEMAISQLERIQGNDPDRDKAFLKVEIWIQKRRSL